MSPVLIIVLIAAFILIAAYFLFWRRKADGDLTEDERAILKARIFDQFEVKGFRKRALLSTMYRAVDKESKKAVALRILRPEYSSDVDQVKSFLRRGEILEYLNKQHPDLALAKLVKHGKTQFGRFSRPFIAVEYFEGMDLHELLSRKKVLTVAEATQIITQIARTLSVALRERVWHHQLAFQAIMVRQADGGTLESKLVDFDVAKQEVNAFAGQTAEGIGKLTFMSPEQFENKIVDERSDMYSLGVIYYTLLTGRPPFMGDDIGEMARLHTTVPPPSLSGHVPAGVQAVVLQMLAKQPIARYKTMDEFLRAISSITPDESWKKQPDTSAVKPLPRRVEEPRPVPRRAAERGQAGSGPAYVSSAGRRARSLSPSTSGRKLGGFFSLILLEFPLMFVSVVGRTITKLIQKITIKKLVIAGLLLVIGVGAYFLFRSNAVTGTVVITVADAQKKGIPNVDVALDPLDESGAASKSAVFTDPLKDVKSKEKTSGKTDNKGEFKVEYAIPPNTRLVVSLVAAGYVPGAVADTVRVLGDSTIARSYALAPAPNQPGGPNALMVVVRDREKNPVPSVTVLVTGKSGTEQSVQVDTKGKGTLTYDVAAEGSNPKVQLSAEALGPEFARSNPKPGRIASSRLEIDINDFFAYDEAIDNQMRQARYLIKEEEWKKAIPVLEQTLLLRPGQGSAETYTLLGQAIFEKDDDDYKEALKMLDKAMTDRNSIAGSGSETVLERMHFYRVRATYEAWNRLRNADPTRPNMKRALLKACNEYKDLFRSPKFKTLLKNEKQFRNNLEDVEDYQGKVD